MLISYLCRYCCSVIPVSNCRADRRFGARRRKRRIERSRLDDRRQRNQAWRRIHKSRAHSNKLQSVSKYRRRAKVVLTRPRARRRVGRCW